MCVCDTALIKLNLLNLMIGYVFVDRLELNANLAQRNSHTKFSKHSAKLTRDYKLFHHELSRPALTRPLSFFLDDQLKYCMH